MPPLPPIVQTEGGLEVRTDLPFNLGLPLLPKPKPARWLYMATVAGLDPAAMEFQERVKSYCATEWKQNVTRRRRALQARFDELHAALATDSTTLDPGGAWEGVQFDLIARALHDTQRSITTEGEAWRRCMQDAALATGQSERIAEERLALTAALLVRDLHRSLLIYGPSRVPNGLAMDLERSLHDARVQGDNPEFQAALQVYRNDSMTALTAYLDAAKAHMRNFDGKPGPRHRLAGALNRVLDVQIAGIRQLGAHAGTDGVRWQRNELLRLHPSAEVLVHAYARLQELDATGLPPDHARTLQDLLQAGERAENASLQALKARATAYFLGRDWNGTTHPDILYAAAMREAVSGLAAAVADTLHALAKDPTDSAAQDLHVRIVRAMESLGALDEFGAWRMHPVNPTWPGGILRGDEEPFRAPATTAAVTPPDPPAPPAP